MEASPVEQHFFDQLDLESNLSFGVPIDEKRCRVFAFLDLAQQNNALKVKDHFKDLQWLNVSRPLSLSNDLKGMIVVCDFFTYCCINCLHVLPILNQFEQKHKAKPVLVLGAHSPKFENEKALKNLSNAILRYNIDHPVCNDVELKLWTDLCINCWPTLVIIGPDSMLLFLLVGEKAIQEWLDFYVAMCLDYFQDKLTGDRARLPLNPLKDSIATDLLYYPTKISTSPKSAKIAIANTLKHSIIVTDTNGITLHIIGSNDSNVSGLKDGTLAEALFNCPQGMTWQNEDVLFVCDSGNHSIRKIKLESGTVETIAGTGQLTDDKKGGSIGTAQALNSPWDIVFEHKHQRLFIAMAGLHQIWQIILLPNGQNVFDVSYPFGSCVSFAGNQQEEKRNSRYPQKAGFAQPSGIAIGDEKLFIADSESSSIRGIDVRTGSVDTIVGGSIDPTDLFSFGDFDGVGLKCRLQHPMAVCADNDDSIFIADTFNHKIKQVFVESKVCQTFQLNWTNVSEELFLSEPNGICFYKMNGKKQLLVCDTNHHRIMRIDLSNSMVNKFNILHLNQQFTQLTTECTDGAQLGTVKVLDPLNVSYGQVEFELKFHFVNDLKAEIEANHRIQISANESTPNIDISPTTFTTLNDLKFNVICQSTNHSSVTLSICCELNLCHETLNYCKFSRIIIKQPVNFLENYDLQTRNSCNKMIKCIEIDV